MNYIKLLNAAFEKFFLDDRLNPKHISLYMALFQEWNSSRFANEFNVNRRDLKLASKIGSNSSYHRCVIDLHSWGYLCYFPSNSPYKGSKIKMCILDTTDEPVMGDYSPTLEQLAERYRLTREPLMGQSHPIVEQVAGQYHPTKELTLGSTINNNKQVNNKKQKGWQAVFDFFIEKGFKADEAKKFFEHYETRNWKTSDGNEIRNWRALAENWIERTVQFEHKNSSNFKELSQIKDNLRTTKNKDYGQPL
jgi:hypothetical protein